MYLKGILVNMLCDKLVTYNKMLTSWLLSSMVKSYSELVLVFDLVFGGYTFAFLTYVIIVALQRFVGDE